MNESLHKAERVLDEVIYHADQNTAASNGDSTWANHARRCREARELVIRAAVIPEKITT